jgi:5'-methylthioadenosine nucleosidase
MMESKMGNTTMDGNEPNKGNHNNRFPRNTRGNDAGIGNDDTGVPPLDGQSMSLAPRRGPIETVVFTFAMPQEAQRWVQALNLTPYESPRNPGMNEQYKSKIGAVNVVVSINQFNLKHGVAGVGTSNSVLNAFCAINEFKPSLLVNAGTAGGFGDSGGVIGDIYLTKGTVMYHDRHIKLGNYEEYGNGGYSCLSLRRLPKILSAKTGVFSTGNSLDYTHADMSRIIDSDALVKDMEAAAFAEIAEQFNVPFIGIKSISDLVDGNKPTPDQFQDNFGLATRNLHGALTKFVRFLANGRRLEDL